MGVTLFIVEGLSDKDTLIPCLEELFLKSRNTQKTLVMHTDFLTEFTSKDIKKYNMIRSNVKIELIKKIKKFMDESNPKIKSKFIDSICYITDTDNCFQFEKETALKVKRARKNKCECLEVLFKEETLLINRKDIPFHVLFFQKQLEDVLYDKNDLSDSEKEILSCSNGLIFKEAPLKLLEHFDDERIKKWTSLKESYEGILTYEGTATNFDIFLREKIKEVS